MRLSYRYNGGFVFRLDPVQALHPPVPALRRDFARWQQLVTPQWLSALQAGARVEAAPAGHWRVLEVGCEAVDSYRAGHIPGAGYLETCALEGGPLWNRANDAALMQVLLAHGVCSQTTVILAGRNVLAAARAAHLMLYLGVADVRLLDGGLAAWERAGLPLAQGLSGPTLVPSAFGRSVPALPHLFASRAQVQALLARADASVASIRSWSEHMGATSGYSYIAACGDIPGARWGRAGIDGDVNSMSDYQDSTGCLLPARAIAAMWERQGITRSQQVAFYCGTGWRASYAFMAAWLMGWEQIAVYDGGWCEWSRAEGL